MSVVLFGFQKSVLAALKKWNLSLKFLGNNFVKLQYELNFIAANFPRFSILSLFFVKSTFKILISCFLFIYSIPSSRWNLLCVLCKDRVGSCIQCSVKTCKVAYHVTCGKLFFLFTMLINCLFLYNDNA